MSAPRLVWLCVVKGPAGELVPISVSQTQEQAIALANEAMDQVSLGLSYHASQSKIDDTKRLFDSIDVRRAWVLIEGDN